MTCRAARRLLPLFAGGDLKEPKTSAVAGHLAACAACRAEVEAYTAARALLPLSSLSFGESERALIRRRVLDEIARPGESRSGFIVSLLRPRYALAALAGAVVLAAALVSPFFARNAGEPAALLPPRPVPSTTPVSVGKHVAETAPSPPNRSTAIARVPRAGRTLRAHVPASKKPGPAVRFEIHTGNVNVRIIWFAGGDSAGEAPPGPNGDATGVS